MRWYVEIAPVDKGASLQKLCLEAGHWQPALQKARKLRGEDDKLSGLSVEFFDDGCRAIDAALRIRYIVTKAPDDAPLVEDPAAATVEPPRAPEPRPSRKKKDKTPRPVLATPATTASTSTVFTSTASASTSASAAAEAAEIHRRTRSTQDFASPGEARESQEPPGEIAPPDPLAPPVPPSHKSPTVPSQKSPTVPSQKSPTMPSQKSPTMPSQKSPTMPSQKSPTVRHKILADVRRDPTPEQPIVFHERAIALQEAIELAQVPAFLRAQLEDLKSRYPGDGATRLVHIGLFDHVYRDKPERPPVATLEWREWRDEDAQPIFFPYGPQAAKSAEEAARLHGRTRIEPGKPTAAALPKLSSRRSDADLEPPSRPVKVVPVVEVGAAAAGKSALAAGGGTSKTTLVSAGSPEAKPVGALARDGKDGAPAKGGNDGAVAKDTSAAPAKDGASKAPAAKIADSKPVDSDTRAQQQKVADVKPAEAKPAEVKPAEVKPAEAKAAEAKAAQAKPAEVKPAAKQEPEPAAPKAGTGTLAGGTPAESRPAAGKPKDEADASADRPSSRHNLAARKPAQKTLASATPADLARATNKAAEENFTGKGTLRSSAPPTSDDRPVSSGQHRTVKLGSGEVRELAPAPPPPEVELEAVSVEERERLLSEARERVSNIPPPASLRGKRSGGEQLITDLFEAVSQLQYISDALDGARFVLSLAMEKLPSEVGLVSWFDIDKREFVVVHQTGGDRSALLTRIAERSDLQRQAMRSHRAVVLSAVKADHPDARWKIIGVEPRSLVCAPVELSGRYLGLIELCNPFDGKAFSESDGHALTYIGERYAEFLNQRGVIIDPEKVVARAQAR